MTIIDRYAEYAAKIMGNYEKKESNIEYSDNYVTRDELMLRGNNEKNIYYSERVRIGKNGRKR